MNQGSSIRTPSIKRFSLVVAACIAGTLAIACGDGQRKSADAPSPSRSADAAGAADVDLAYVRDMLPHLDLTLALARIGKRRGASDVTQRLAERLTASHRSEVAAFQDIGVRLDAQGARPGDLGVPRRLMGVGIDRDSLLQTRSFDRSFATAVAELLRGVMRLSRAELARGVDPAARRLARSIIARRRADLALISNRG